MIILTRARRYVSLSLSLSNLNDVLAKLIVLNFVKNRILCEKKTICTILMLICVVKVLEKNLCKCNYLF